MKKNNFDNRLANDLFPEMPVSFEAGLKKTMQEAGIKTKKRLSATGLFTGIISVAAAAACLVIVLLGVLGGGKGKINAAVPGASAVAAATPQSAFAAPVSEWKGETKVIALSSGFDFENQEKFAALHTGILTFLRNKGEAEPAELWMCAIKSRFVKEDTGHREDGYLDGYYVLAQHSFGPDDGPELYCLAEDGEVLWVTEGSALGPNHAVHPKEDSYPASAQGHFLYGMAPTDGHVTRGAVVGMEKGTDIEFSMAASLTEVRKRLAAANSAYADGVREYFLLTVPASSWDYVMQAHTLRFETQEGLVDVDIAAEIPLVKSLAVATDQGDTDVVKEAQYGVERWLSQNRPVIRDFTDDWYGEAVVQQYAEAVRRALLISGEHIQDELWICGAAYDWEYEDGTPPSSVYVLALNAGDGEPSPELFYYENGRILWMTKGASDGRINVIHHNGNAIIFGKSPAFDNRPLPMTYGKVVLTDGSSDSVFPVLPLEKIQERLAGGPLYYSARECYLWIDREEVEPRTVTIAAEIDGKTKEFTLDKVNVLTPQAVPAMAVESGGVVYPGRVTLMAHSLNEDGVATDGTPIEDTLANGILFKTTYTWQRPLTILTASDTVTVDAVDVYLAADGQLDGADLSLADIDSLPPGTYYLCFHTTVLGPYSEQIGRYPYQTDFTIYKVKLK